LLREQIMICLMLSKWVGDQFNISLYDLHVELKCIPFVEGTPSEGMEQMNAIDVATTPVVTLEQVRCRRLLAVSSDTCCRPLVGPARSKPILESGRLKLCCLGGRWFRCRRCTHGCSRRRTTASLS